jgi:hypothetical protein
VLAEKLKQGQDSLLLYLTGAYTWKHEELNTDSSLKLSFFPVCVNQFTGVLTISIKGDKLSPGMTFSTYQLDHYLRTIAKHPQEIRKNFTEKEFEKILGEFKGQGLTPSQLDNSEGMPYFFVLDSQETKTITLVLRESGVSMEFGISPFLGWFDTHFR